MRDFVKEVKEFNELAGTPEQFDSRKAALYVGLILEEVSEMIDSFQDKNWNTVSTYLNTLGNDFKSGVYDGVMDSVNRTEFLDAAVDIAVVSLGAGIAIGGDIEGATLAVSENNLSKFPLIDGKRVVLKDGNGKIKKPEGFKAVDLEPFVK